MEAKELEALAARCESAAKSAESAAKKAGASGGGSRVSQKTKDAKSFVFLCLCCDGALVPAHVEASGVVVACPSCRMAVRFAAQVIRPPDADAVADKLEAAYECGRTSKRAYQRAHNVEETPKPPEPDEE